MACSRTPRRGPSSLVISIEQRHWRLLLLPVRLAPAAVPALPGAAATLLFLRSARGLALYRRQLRRVEQGDDRGLCRNYRVYALEQRAWRVSRRRRMEVVAGADRLLGADQ